MENDIFSDCLALVSVSVHTNNPAYLSIDGVLFDRPQTTFIFYPPAKVSPVYVVPDAVTTIKSFAFDSCA